MNLRKKAYSGVRWTTFSSLTRTIFQIIQISILARVLTPADFGLMALVTSYMAFLQIFSDAGISNAIIHYQDISQKHLSSLYWLNVGVSFCLALLLSVVSPWIAGWYSQPQLRFLLFMAGYFLVVRALAQQIRVVAQKNLRFAELARIDFSAAFIGFIVAVATALNGAGVYSIMAGSLAAATIESVLVWYLLSGGWYPQFRLKIKEIQQFVAFGGYVMGNNLVNTFNSQIDIMLGGKFLGSQALGLYSMPKDLNLRIAGVINPIVTNVGLPVMARAQNDIDFLKRVYLQTIRMTASVNFPIYLALVFFTPEIVNILLGAKWEEAIPLVPIFAVWGLVRSTGNPIGSLLMARGRADLSFKWNLMWLCITPPIIWCGSHYGAKGMSIAMTALVLMSYWPNWYFQVRPLCNAKFWEYSAQIIIPLNLSIWAGVFGFISVICLTGDLLRLTIGLSVGAVIYIVLSRRFNSMWFESMRELILNPLHAK